MLARCFVRLVWTLVIVACGGPVPSSDLGRRVAPPDTAIVTGDTHLPDPSAIDDDTRYDN